MAKTNVPRLRFREFDGEWKEKRLKDIAVKEKDKNSNGEYKDVLTNSAIYGVVDQKTFFDKSIANESNITGYYIVKTNDFVYNPRISVNAKFGPVNRNKLNKTGIVSPLYFVFKIENMDLNFIDFFFKGSKWHQYIYKNGNSGARSDRVSISDSDFMDMPIIFPFKDEQQKIGSFFAKIDKIIDLQEKKIQELKKLKQGYLQKMFPQDGESKPRLRFNGFSGEWEKQGLLNLAKLRTGSRNAEDGINNGKFVFFDRSSEIKFLNEYDFDGEVIVYAGEGAKFLPRKFNGKYSLHQRAYGIYDFKNINFEFLYQELINKNNHFLKYAVGTTAKSLRKDCFEKLTIKYPSVDEQQKIGSFLSKLDEIINGQSDKIDELKQQKRAYLQKMFI